MYAGLPVCGSERFGTFSALLGVNEVHHLETLLKEHAFLDGVLDGELDLDTPRMRLRPDETSIDDSDLVQPLQLLQTQR